MKKKEERPETLKNWLATAIVKREKAAIHRWEKTRRDREGKAPYQLVN